MSAPNRKGTGGSYTEAILLFCALGLIVAVVGGVWVAAHWGTSLAGLAAPPAHPVELIAGLLAGEVFWPVQSTVVAASLGAAVLVLVLLTAVLVARSAKNRTRVDKAAVHMGRGRDLNHLFAKGAKATAVRLGVEGSAGVPLGRTVAGKRPVFASWEDMLILIAGPRTMKTTSYAVPAMLEATGAVIATSNKRDIVDVTRPVRSQAGQTWVFDPQGVAEEPPSWWWNPLSYVTDEAAAAKLATHFAAGSRQPGARADAFFDTAGKNLLKAYLLAAALDHQPITQVYTWLTRQADDTPATILRGHGYLMLSDTVVARLREPDKQRAGVFGTALEMVSSLTDRTTGQWITPRAGPARPEFDPEDFVRGTGTLYSLSREGEGTAGPLVAALTVAVVEAAEKYAVSQPAGRLKRPLLGVLDEAANVCRWKNLPDQYSHYGSRGIILMTILQSWSQGVDVWGIEGMRKLWSAANIKVYGGGVSEAGYLDELSRLIGHYAYTNISRSTGKTGRSTSRTENKDDILSVADLAALPRFRAVLMASGAPATMIETIPWMNGPHAGKVTTATNDDQRIEHGPEKPAPQPWAGHSIQ